MNSWKFGGITIYQGNCLDVLPTLPAESVQACITSPPYWGLRDYGTARWEGGEAGCDHHPPKSRKGGESEKQNSNVGSWGTREWLTCGKCGAIRIDQQLGLERVPDCGGAFTRNMWELRPDLTDEEVAYVYRELVKAGVLGRNT